MREFTGKVHDRCETALRFCQETGRPISILITKDRPIGAFHCGHQLVCAAEDGFSCLQFFLFSRAEFCPFQFFNLKLKDIQPTCFLRLIHLQRGNLPAQGIQFFVCLLVTGKGCVQTAEIVQILQMTGFIQQLLTVMLPMDINQLAAQSL